MANVAHLCSGSWQTFRGQVVKLNPDLARVIDQMDSDDSFRLYKLRYPYGSEIIKAGEFFVPNASGGLSKIGDPDLGAQVNQDLSYNARSLPIGILLQNSIEVYINHQDKSLPLLGHKDYVGKLFGLYRVLQDRQSNFRVPHAIWNLSAGCRSMFMLPKISNELAHKKINTLIAKHYGRGSQHAYLQPPKTLSEQWSVFCQLYQSGALETSWDVEVIFFSHQWFKQPNDPSWGGFYNYLYRNLISVTDYFRKNQTWEAMLSLLDLDKNMTHNSYINQEVRHILGVATGEMPAFAPASDNKFAPVQAIQTVYQQVYGLEYVPTLIQPAFLDAKGAGTVYYSMNHPITLFANYKSHDSSVISNLSNCVTLVKRYMHKVAQQQPKILLSQFETLLSEVEFNFYHPKAKSYPGIKNSTEIVHTDSSWKCPSYLEGNALKNNSCNAIAEHGAFFQGCIQIKLKRKSTQPQSLSKLCTQRLHKINANSCVYNNQEVTPKSFASSAGLVSEQT